MGMPMPTTKFTEAGVRRLKPPPKPQQADYFETLQRGRSLILRVGYGGKKTWRVLHYLSNGKARSARLGQYPAMGVQAARKAARTFDPQAAVEKARVGTFGDVAETFMRRHVEANKLRSKAEIDRCLRVYIYPRWRDRPFLDIRRADVAALLDVVEDKHGPRQADVILAIISKMTRWYQARSDDYISPVVPGMRRTKPSERKRKRILNDDELRRVWEAGEGAFGAFVKVALLTGQREGKVKTMRWDDIVDGEWCIPAAQREKAHAGTLRLSQMALDIIAEQPRIADNPFVFPGRGKGHFNSFSQRKAELDAKLGDMEPWTIHDLRRTARSLMARAGVRPDIAERVLGHAIPGVEGVYDRHSYADEKADAVTKLAALMGTIIDWPQAGNVVALRG
jgi:integrase